MKITIIGTHSTGKSTILKHLAEKLKQQNLNVYHVTELARCCPFPVNEDTTYEAQMWIQEKQIQEEVDYHTHDTIVLCDRATLDNFAYMERAITDTDLTSTKQRALDHMNTYDFIFKTQKLDIRSIDDDFRDTTDTFRDDIDTRITTLLEDNNISYHLLPKTTDYDTHVHVIMDLIEKHKT